MRGRVARIMHFGAFVTILPGTDGLVHISQISADKSIRVEKVSDELSEGDTIKVKVIQHRWTRAYRLKYQRSIEGSVLMTEPIDNTNDQAKARCWKAERRS